MKIMEGRSNIPQTIIPRTIQACLQSDEEIRRWTIAGNAAQPAMPPRVVTAMALPLNRMNHIETKVDSLVKTRFEEVPEI